MEVSFVGGAGAVPNVPILETTMPPRAAMGCSTVCSEGKTKSQKRVTNSINRNEQRLNMKNYVAFGPNVRINPYIYFPTLLSVHGYVYLSRGPTGSIVA